MLGLYDSGLGGLTVLAALRRAGVTQDVLYFADQAHVPYGDRTDADLYTLLAGNFALLDAHGVEAVIMACNTSCAIAARRGGFPPARGPVLDLIGNAAQALRDTRARRVAVFATAATVRSGAYRRAIGRTAPQLEVFEIAAPALVPLVEAGAAASPQAYAAVGEVCTRLPRGIDAIIYGCTHYPLLDAHFAAHVAPHIERIDPAVAQAAATCALVQARALASGTGLTQYLTNADLATFQTNVRAWTGDRHGTFGSVAALAS